MSNVSPVHVLLVDDKPANLIALQALLDRDDLILLKAHSGAEALELLLQYDVALALLDVQMPEMDGFELAEFMRGMERTRHVPIIFVTAGATDGHRLFKGYEAGAVDFIQKPIEPHILSSKIQIFIDLYRLRKELADQRDALTHTSLVLKEHDQAKDQFMAILAHELRNPVAALMGGIELLGRRRQPEQIDEICSGMHRMLHHLSRMVDDLVDVSRINTGKVSLRPERIDLREVVASAIGGSRHNIEAGQHELIVDIPEDALWFQADYTRVSQVVGNLLNNAAKFTPAGGTITLRGRQVEIGLESWVEISVSDTGVGIPLAMKDKIFDFFVQGAIPPAHSRGGLGIGLALVRQLVDLHHGSVTVESAGEGQGSTFTVRLPVTLSIN